MARFICFGLFIRVIVFQCTLIVDQHMFAFESQAGYHGGIPGEFVEGYQEMHNSYRKLLTKALLDAGSPIFVNSTTVFRQDYQALQAYKIEEDLRVIQGTVVGNCPHRDYIFMASRRAKLLTGSKIDYMAHIMLQVGLGEVGRTFANIGAEFQAFSLAAAQMQGGSITVVAGACLVRS